ncbi:DUF4197 domain-containing protein [Flavobacterium coralii]|uniref:DUF4197 domain-containing protein n=1 Tax=Flavobacterium coralii TaxID=2838017 RepID=UPI000C3B4059|nr:hypothetical protein [Flavobacterium sp.]|tara:strand:+ start:10071 stop:10799 length:729 start_codon:yes stop_codon:yes gene_type:complete
MRRSLILALTILLAVSANAQFKNVLNKSKEKLNTSTGTSALSNAEIGSGLKKALKKGVDDQVQKLTAVDGFYKNKAVKILLPEELQKVDKTLRKMGMANLADEGIKVLNRAAEDAVKEAPPIFTNAIMNMSFTDAKNILMGADNSATQYLQRTTTSPLYSRFSPVVSQSLDKVGANEVWAKIIDKYNSLPLVSKVNPNLTDYVTNKALDGVFTMIAVEEKNIRTNLSSRSSDLLKKVFALQD